MVENQNFNNIFLENFKNKRLSTEGLLVSNLKFDGEYLVDELIINYDKSQALSKSVMDFIIL